MEGSSIFPAGVMTPDEMPSDFFTSCVPGIKEADLTLPPLPGSISSVEPQQRSFSSLESEETDISDSEQDALEDHRISLKVATIAVSLFHQALEIAFVPKNPEKPELGGAIRGHALDKLLSYKVSDKGKFTLNTKDEEKNKRYREIIREKFQSLAEDLNFVNLIAYSACLYSRYRKKKLKELVDVSIERAVDLFIQDGKRPFYDLTINLEEKDFKPSFRKDIFVKDGFLFSGEFTR